MTKEEFNATGWTPGMTADYQGKTYPIASCDFEEQLIGLHRVLDGAPEDIVWVRCENAIVHKPNAQGEFRRDSDVNSTALLADSERGEQ